MSLLREMVIVKVRAAVIEQLPMTLNLAIVVWNRSCQRSIYHLAAARAHYPEILRPVDKENLPWLVVSCHPIETFDSCVSQGRVYVYEHRENVRSMLLHATEQKY